MERRQSQEALRPGLTPAQREELERLHSRERWRLQQLQQQEAREEAANQARAKELPASAPARRALDERASTERREQEQRRFEQEAGRILDRDDPAPSRRYDMTRPKE